MTTKRWWPRIRMRGLAFKVTALVFGAVFLSVTVNAVMLFLREQREELKDLQAHATAMAQLVAANSEYAVYTGSSDGLQSLVQRLDDMDEIAYVRILRLAGDTVMDRRLNAASAGATLLGVDPSHVVRRLRIGGDDVLDIAVPIVTASASPAGSDQLGPEQPQPRAPLGFVQMGVSLRPTQDYEQQLLKQITLATLAFLVLAMPVAHFLTRRVTAPMRALAKAAAAVGDGHFEALPENDVRDEMGMLARAFNLMLQRLNAQWSELETSAKTAREASRAKSHFLANMSHEIRTPLNGVLGMLELLTATELGQRQRRFADIAHRSAEELLELINEVLDYSKIEAGHLTLHCLDFDLRQMVEEVCEALAPRAHQKGLEFVVRISPEFHASVYGDSMRLRQVMLNLLSNAIKFTVKGSVQVRVSTEAVAGLRQRVRFEVRDSGIGIPPEKVGALFHPFVQADSSTTREFGGTGLGLAIGKQLVELMGGEVGFETTAGVGSTFWFDVALDQRAPADDAASTSAPTLSGRRVLVIDDNETNREVLREQLMAWGALVDEAEDGAGGLEQLRRMHGVSPYDVVVLDYAMPSMNGGAVAQQIRANPLWASLPILLLSSVEGLSFGTESSGPVDAILTKPARQRDLAERIAALAEGGAFGRMEHVPIDPKPEPDDLPTVMPVAPFAGVRVLLAEDNTVNQFVAAGLLESFGCHVVVAENGLEAVREAQSGSFDLIFMDCMMPVMDGYEATRSIRVQQRHTAKPIPIVALTASALEGERERCLEAGMDDYVPKPFRADDLMAVVRRWIHAAAAATDSPQSHDTPVPEAAGQALDMRAIEEFEKFPGGLSILSDCIGAYRNHAPEQLAALRSAIATNQRTEIHRMAHTLKSSSAMLGASQLALLMRQIETQAAGLDLAALDQLRVEAERLYGLAAEALEAYVVASA